MKTIDVKNALAQHASASDAVFLQRFFKTGKGQYGEGDVFIGVRVPMTRSVCKQFSNLPLQEVRKLLASKVHEHRLAAVILLSNRFKEVDAADQAEIYHVYMKAVDNGYVNNWDIVDVSAEFIVGEYLYDRPRDALLKLAKHPDVWHRRVAVLSTFGFIKKGDFSTTLEIATILLHDPHDLIQKAVGWMLREIGKRGGRQQQLDFLEKHYKTMPRTMLRYAIEHLTSEQRAYFMRKTKEEE